MGKRQRLGVFFIEPERDRNGSRDLRNLYGVREPVTEMIGKAGREDLGFPFEPPEGARVNDAVAIALEIASIRMPWFRESASMQTVWTQSKSGQHSSASYWFNWLVSSSTARVTAGL